jgi:hypothetical protein
MLQRVLWLAHESLRELHQHIGSIGKHNTGGIGRRAGRRAGAAV